MDCSAVVLNKIISERNLDLWAKLKLAYLDPAFSGLYSAIGKYYDTYNGLPSYEELELQLRQGAAQKTLATLKLTDDSEIDAEVAFDALLDQYTQAETIKELDRFLDKLPVYDSQEIKENLSQIVLKLDEKTVSSENIVGPSDILLFRDAAEALGDRVYLGFNNTFDAALGGVALEELIYLGGRRGAGKSILCSNMHVAQYELGNMCPYFTIEMKAREVLERNMAILANVNHQSLKKNELTPDEVLSLVKARANMFHDAQELVLQFMEHNDRYKFESALIKTKEPKDNQMVIVDDRDLSISTLDLHLGKFKTRFGDKFKVAIVDYVNQIAMPQTASLLSQYDWKPQVEVSKQLKNLARKYGIVMLSPYQIDASGEARFAKGILDAADIALVMEAHDKDTGALSFESTKLRGATELKFTSGINWETLRISPIPIDKPSKQEEPKEDKPAKKAKKPPVATGEPDNDTPPWG